MCIYLKYLYLSVHLFAFVDFENILLDTGQDITHQNYQKIS